MGDSGSDRADICKQMQELVVWYPGGSLDADERGKVESHIAECAACADLLQFATEFKGVLQERYSPHPEAGALVSFAENKAAMDPQGRLVVEKHLAACTDCREQVAMLQEVDRDDTEELMPETPVSETREIHIGARSGLRGFWDSLKGSVLRPVPAAFYLAVAVLAVGFILLQPDGWLARISARDTGRIGLQSGAGLFPGTLGGIVILPDETGRMRQQQRDESTGVEIDVTRSQFLLLELTALQDPPAAEEEYTVRLVRKGETEPVFEALVRGKVFSENYTLCLSLEKAALKPGDYVVRVISPNGDPVYRSSIVAQ